MTSSEDWRAGGFGVYVHWPFCQSKCPYCDFNSHVWAEIDQARWRSALLAELRAAHEAAPNRRADTVFFGGGTPSLMAPETVASLVAEIERLWGLAPGAEITLEANPSSVEAGRFRGYAEAGVNRVSIGVQALNDADLKALGRLHGAREARAAFDVARAAFERVSFDLIYARPGQTLEAWRAELDAALAMAADHLSLYQLTIEPGTRFGDLYDRGRLAPPPDDAAAEMYELTQERCEAAGMPAYEISNHARPGAESRHNLIYWRYGDYAGVGPGAHGRLTKDGERIATETLRDPAAWLAAVEAAGAAWREWTPLTGAEQGTEMMLMGMRLAEGVDLGRYARLARAAPHQAALEALLQLGLLEGDGPRIWATKKGRLVLNASLRELLIGTAS